MAFTPFQQGQQFAQAQEARELGLEQQRNRAAALEILRNTQGIVADAPDIISTIEQGRRADARLELQRQQAGRQAQQDELALADRDRQLQQRAAVNTINFFRQGIQSGVPVAEIAQRAAPALQALGVTPEQFGPLVDQITNDPGVLDQLEAAIGQGGQTGASRTAIGRPVPVRLSDGRTGLLQTFNDGSSQIVEGVTPLQEELGERRVAAQQPGFRGQVAEEQVVGRARGERRAEDLPTSRRAQTAARRANEARQQRSDFVAETIDRAIEQADVFSAGLLSGTAILGGGPAANLQETLRQVQSFVSFDELQRLRDASPTGGALGQVSNVEIQLLQSALGSLSQSQSPSQLRSSLRRLRDQIRQSDQRIAEAFEEDFGVPYSGAGTQIPETVDVAPDIEALLDQFAPRQ